MEIPKKLRIGGIDYTVEIVDFKDSDFIKVTHWGHCYHGECKIILNNNINKQKLWQTLLHEAVHIIDNEYNVGLDEDNVDRITSGLYAFLKDNKINFD